MDPHVATFLDTGRRFRARVSTGSVLLVGMEPQIREIVETWLLQHNVPILSSATIEEAEAFLSQRPKCVVFGLDGQDYAAAVAFLQRVDREQPSSISVVVSCWGDHMKDLRAKLPRLTFIYQGNGLRDELERVCCHGLTGKA